MRLTFCVMAVGLVLSGCGPHGHVPVNRPAEDAPRPVVTALKEPAKEGTKTVPEPPREELPQTPAIHDELVATPAATPSRTVDEAVGAVNGQLVDVYFPYDRMDLTPEGVAALQRDAELLKSVMHDFPGVQLVIEGHCDERGSAEYNIGLGDRRARAAAEMLERLGVAGVRTISYGKERPQCVAANEECWRLNRRAHLNVQRATSSEQ